NPLDKDAEKKYGSYKDIWRDGDYIVEIIANPRLIPQIMPFNGVLIKLKFKGALLQCQNCFQWGHTKTNCKHQRIRVQDYEKGLKAILMERRDPIDNGSNAIVGIEEDTPLVNDLEEITEVCPGEQLPREKDLTTTVRCNDEEETSSTSVLKITTISSNNSIHREDAVEGPEIRATNTNITPALLDMDLRDEGCGQTPEVIQEVHEEITVDCTRSDLSMSNNGRGVQRRLSKSHIDPNQILEFRTRSGSTGKRRQPDGD
ncbi:Uncharacterized protein FKW44_000787, partial [Caligus rogercresseyi]